MAADGPARAPGFLPGLVPLPRGFAFASAAAPSMAAEQGAATPGSGRAAPGDNDRGQTRKEIRTGPPESGMREKTGAE